MSNGSWLMKVVWRGHFEIWELALISDLPHRTLPCNSHSVKSVPVNYAIRFSGPVTPSPPAVAGVVPESFNMPARCSARYKCSLVPRRFPSSSLLPFPPFNFPIRPHRALGFDELHLPLQPVSPQREYDAASETNASSQSPALIRSTPPTSLNRSSLSSSRPTVAVMLMTCLAPGRPRCGHTPAADAGPPLRSPSLLDNAASARWLATSLLPHSSPISTTAGVGWRKGPDLHWLRCDKGQLGNPAYSARCPLMQAQNSR
jgi:hypothetical protein